MRGKLLTASAAGLLIALGAAPADAAPIAPNGGAAIDETPTGTVTLTPGPNITTTLTSKMEGPLALGSPITGNLGTNNGVAPPGTGFSAGASVNGGAMLVVPYTNGAIPTISLTIGTLTFQFNFAEETPPVPPVATTGTTAGSFQIDVFGNLTADTSGTFITGPLGTGINQPASFSETCTQTTTAAPVSCSDTLAIAVAAVPEPASLALLGSALAGFGWFAGRRRKAA